MPKSELVKLLNEFCVTSQDDPNFLQIAGKVQQAYAEVKSRPRPKPKAKDPLMRELKICSDCGSSRIIENISLGQFYAYTAFGCIPFSSILEHCSNKK